MSQNTKLAFQAELFGLVQQINKIEYFLRLQQSVVVQIGQVQ